MHYDGITKVSLHGPVSSLLGLTGLREKWGKNSPEAIQFEYLLEGLPLQHLASLPPEFLETCTIDAFETDLAILSCLEGVAQEKPELEIAIAAEATNSVFGTTGYCSYYSAAGENTIHPDEFTSFCDSKPRIPVTIINYKGEKVEFDFADIPDIDEASSSWGSLSMSERSEGDLDQIFFSEEQLFVVLCLDNEGNWSWLDIDIDDMESDECEILDEEYGHYVEDGTPTYDVLICSDSECEELPAKFFLRVMKIMQPDLDIRVERKNNRVHLLDNDGNEYFLPCMLNVGELVFNIDWGFPKTSTWIPF